jgi:hypothetical protein
MTGSIAAGTDIRAYPQLSLRLDIKRGVVMEVLQQL